MDRRSGKRSEGIEVRRWKGRRIDRRKEEPCHRRNTCAQVCLYAAAVLTIDGREIEGRCVGCTGCEETSLPANSMFWTPNPGQQERQTEFPIMLVFRLIRVNEESMARRRTRTRTTDRQNREKTVSRFFCYHILFPVFT